MNCQGTNDIKKLVDDGKISFEELSRKANKYLEKNNLEQAYPLISVMAECVSATIHTILTAGLIALSLNKKEEAGEYFRKAVAIDTNNYDANYNLALFTIGEGQYAEARELLEHLVTNHPRDAKLYNDLAVVELNLNQYNSARENWEKALTIDPNYTMARDNALGFLIDTNHIDQAEQLLDYNSHLPDITPRTKMEIEAWLEKIDDIVSPREKVAPLQLHNEGVEIAGKKIVIFAAIDTFVKDIRNYLAENNEVKIFNEGNQREMLALMEWADLAWFEWCDNFIVEATRLPKTCPIVCRLHSYEAFTNMPAQVDWQKVDLLVFVNDSVKDIFEKQVTTAVPKAVIHNAVDSRRFNLPQNKNYGKKIASVGYINYKKNPALLLYCFKKIHEYDPEYTLHIAGQHQDSRIKLYFDHFLSENPLPVQFYGWVDDMPKWYEDKDFIISTSLFESFHYSIAEGMASGLMPLIHNWYGAQNIYPKEYLFVDPEACLNLLKKLESSDRRNLAEKNRNHIVKHYDLEDKLTQIGHLLQNVVAVKSKTAQLV